MSKSKQFAADRSGNFAMIAAILSVPLVMGAGVALDISTISRIKSELQQSIDTAALAVAREGTEISDARAEEIAATFLSQNLDPRYTKLVVDRDGTVVDVKAQTHANLAFGNLFGYDDWPILASASADTAYMSYEVALVLDTTGSMAGGKLISMKDAVVGLVDTMSEQVTDKKKLKFSLVPFSSFVNVGPQYGPDFDEDGRQIAGTGADWLDLKGQTPVEQTELDVGASRFQIYHNLGQEWTGCVETRMPGDSGYDTSNALPDADRPETLFVPAFAIDEPDHGRYVNSYIESDVDPLDDSNRARKKKWAKYGVETNANGNPLNGGLIGKALGMLLKGNRGNDDDDDDDDENDGGRRTIPIDTGSSGYGGLRKGPGFGCVSQPIVPLTNDYAELETRVEALEAAGNTNIMEGVAWGARVLTPGEPLAGAQDHKPGIDKIMIVLTDGANVFGNNNTNLGSFYSSYGYLVDGRLGIPSGNSSATNSAMNAKTLEACESAKEDGITVYTIRLEEPDVATGTMLRECATSPAHYFDAPSRTQLDEVFQAIRDRIVKVRLAS